MKRCTNNSYSLNIHPFFTKLFDCMRQRTYVLASVACVSYPSCGINSIGGGGDGVAEGSEIILSPELFVLHYVVGACVAWFSEDSSHGAYLFTYFMFSVSMNCVFLSESWQPATQMLPSRESPKNNALFFFLCFHSVRWLHHTAACRSPRITTTKSPCDSEQARRMENIHLFSNMTWECLGLVCRLTKRPMNEHCCMPTILN